MSIVDLEIIDKRKTGRVLTNMEVAGLRKLLEGMVWKLALSEIVNDSSTSIIGELVRRMKGTYINNKILQFEAKVLVSNLKLNLF